MVPARSKPPAFYDRRLYKRIKINRINYLIRKPNDGLIKKALRKFEYLALRNEIVVTKVWICNLIVSRT